MSKREANLQAGKMTPHGALPVPSVTPDMLSLTKTGIVYSLAVVHHEGILVPEPMVPYVSNG